MKNNHFTRQFAACLTTLATTFIFASAALAEGPIQGTPSSGGGGVGIGIDIGSVINILKNANKGEKCDPKVLQEAQKTCAVKSSSGPVGATQEVVDKDCVKKLCEAGGTSTTVVVKQKSDDNDRNCNPEVERGAHQAFHAGLVKGMTEEMFVKKSCEDFKQQEGRKITFTSPASRNFSNKRNAKQGATCKVNGDFETGGFASWAGANNGLDGSGRTSTAISTITTLGISSGAINLDSTRQTMVSAGNDPVIGSALQQVRPGGGGSAVRIGNAYKDITYYSGYGAELLSKSFKVTPVDAVIGFSYAVVLDDGGHGNGNPKFMVRVLDSSGNDITNNIAGGRVHLQTGQMMGNTPVPPNELIADATNPFFQQANLPPYVIPVGYSGSSTGQTNVTVKPTIIYKDWSCAEINLADLVGQDVTVEFITQDCIYSGHTSYAYVDDFCTTCGKGPEGWLELAESDTCGTGQICVDVGLPKSGKNIGQALVMLDIWQNGIKVKTFTSPSITTDGKSCFNIDPNSISGLDLTKGFDYSASADMTIPKTTGGGVIHLPPKNVGLPKDGTQLGINNDYTPKCPEPCASCGTATTPLCPPCGQQGQPLCPACGQAGQPACPVVTTCTPNMAGCVVIEPPDVDCVPGSPNYPLCKYNPPPHGDCLFPPCKGKPPVSDPKGKPKTECIPKIKPMKDLPTKAAVKPKAKPRPKPVVSSGDAPKPAVNKPKRKSRPKPAQNSSPPAEAPFDDGC